MHADLITEAVAQFVDHIGEDPMEVNSIDITPQRLTVRKFVLDEKGHKQFDHRGQPRLSTEHYWFRPLGEHGNIYD